VPELGDLVAVAVQDAHAEPAGVGKKHPAEIIHVET
jgi:hypothetical protein